jgi:hypothetical protein
MTSKLSGLCYIQITSTALEIGMNFFFFGRTGVWTQGLMLGFRFHIPNHYTLS